MKPLVEMQGTEVELRIGSLIFRVIMYVPAGQLAVGLDPELFKALHVLLRPGDTVIDGGANDGWMSLVIATLVGTEGKVVAFEPEPNNIGRFQQNLKLNKDCQTKIASIELVEKALWSREEKLILHLTAEDGEHCLADLGKYEVSQQWVPTTTIDAMGIKPRVIKLDVEGSEIEALKGARRTIRDNGSYVVCECNRWALERFGESQHSLRAFAKDNFNYDTYVLTRFHAYPLFVPPGVEIATTIANVNVLMATTEMLAVAYPSLDYGTPLSIDQHIQ